MSFRNDTDVCFVSMPISDVSMPSMALSLMKSCLTEAGISSVIDYEHLRYAHRQGLELYRLMALARNDFLVGEMVFARAAHGEKTLRSLDEYLRWMREVRIPQGGATPAEVEIARTKWMEKLEGWQKDAEAYIEEAAARVLSYHPKIVALASMFQQTNANIALARRLKKEKNPPVIVVGGANCMGDLGAALIEHIEAYDYVFIGEADEIFADVCGRILKEGIIPPKKLPYGVLSRLSPRPKTVMHRVTKDVEHLPIPDFDDFFQTYQELFPEETHVHFMVEGSRGCWWGRNKPCTFCGLNGPARNYREKTTKRLVDELATLAERYPKAKICVFTDSILSHTQMKELPAALKARGIELYFFSEIKANLTEEDVRALSGAGFIQLQPGIESLQDDILKIMNKGCRAIRQIETLKSCRAYNMQVAWNLLCGFPGEKEEQYDELAALLPKVMHLPAPNQIIHIVYQRYGEYTENPEKYGLSLQPAEVYSFIYADEEFVRRSAYIFEPVDPEARHRYWDVRLIGESCRKIQDLAMDWTEHRWNLQRLDMYDNGKTIDIYDMRKISRHAVYSLDGAKAELYRAARSVRQEEPLLEELSPKYEEDELRAALDWLCEENLMVHIGHEYLALAVDMNAKK
ncbi:MAG: RiPP maturation radical SAM C-methyltransferase [Schwartzia sp.]|nr:RiPP maturation radical SAM C-methyltransferase [Schwartzia sp. (in: firmicutes)]